MIPPEPPSLPSAANDPYRRQESCEPGPHPKWIDDLRIEVRKEVHAKKLDRRGKKILARNKVRPVIFGPMRLPIEWLCSSRWCETRTNLPLARDRETWKIAWEFWRTAETYRRIKESIETFGMRDPIRVDLYLNWNHADSTILPHGCLAFSMEHYHKTPFITGTGNERCLMAQFEWNWKSIPSIVCVRDYRHNPHVSVALRFVSKLFPYKKHKRPIMQREEILCEETSKI